MRRFEKYLIIFIFTGYLYILMEIAFRGYSHWTMAIAGGLCGILLYTISTNIRAHILVKGLLGGLAITAVELLAGIIINIVFKLDVWDYSHHPLNLLGQICPLFTALWATISVPAMKIYSLAETHIFAKLTRLRNLGSESRAA